MVITGKTWHPRVVELLRGMEEGRVSYDLDGVNFNTLCDDYLCTINYDLKKTRKRIEHEFEVLSKEAWIIPDELFTQLNPSLFSEDFALKVWRTQPESTNRLILDCWDYFPPSFGLMIATILALSFGKKEVADLLQKCIARISTVNVIMPHFINLVIGSPKIIARLTELTQYVQSKDLTEDFDINEDIEKHTELNPKLFDGTKLKKEVREKALEVANELIKTLEEADIPFKLQDIVLTGSNASYNYTKDSDADIHLIADLTGIEDPDNVYPSIFNAYKSAFNSKYDIDFYGISVEVYIESADTKVVSNGIYSILNNTWIKEPEEQNIPEIDLAEIADTLKPWEDEYKKLVKAIESAKIADETPINNFIDALYEIRAKGLSTGGEYSVENLLFKEFRNKGYLDNLKTLRDQVISQRLSITESKQTNISKEDKDLADLIQFAGL